MARPRNTDGDIDELGVLITAAYGLSDDWMIRGACYGWGSQRPYQPTPWQVAPGKKLLDGVKTSELVKYALLLCHNCPAQYDCATYAVLGQMMAGTWAMPITQLRDLQALGHQVALDLIDWARANSVSMQEVASNLVHAPSMSNMRPLIPFCNVKISGGLWAGEETYDRCRVTLNGTPATVTLYSAQRGEDRHKPIDRLTDATVREAPGGYVVEGVSEELVQIVGLLPEDAVVRWEIDTTGCQDCG